MAARVAVTASIFQNLTSRSLIFANSTQLLANYINVERSYAGRETEYQFQELNNNTMIKYTHWHFTVLSIFLNTDIMIY